MDEQVRKLFGFAGTGKSTLAQEINAMVGGAALACAYTGKAASVMAKKGLPGASTVHSLIYTPVGDGKQRVRELEEELGIEIFVRAGKRLTGLTAPGEAVLVHRHLVHGVAPWGEQASASPDGRMIAYIRPEFSTIGEWLDAP